MKGRKYKLNLFKLRVSGIDLRRQFKPILQLIELSFKTLMDLDLSWCNLSFENAHELFKCLMAKARQHADIWYNGHV